MTQSEDIRNLVNAGELLIVGAMYDISTGEVEFYYDPPRTQPV